MKFPKTDDGFEVQLSPDTLAKAQTYDTSLSTEALVTLQETTRFLEITALVNGVFMKYATGVSSSDFDEFIAAGTTRHYVVPNGVTAVSIIEETASASVVVIEK